MHCSNCGYELSIDDCFCENCGAPVEAGRRRKSGRDRAGNTKKAVLIAVLLGLLLGTGGGAAIYKLMHQNVKIRYCVSETSYNDSGLEIASKEMVYPEGWKNTERFTVACYRDGARSYQDHYSSNFVRREYESKILLKEMQTAYEQNGKVGFVSYEAADNANLGFQKIGIVYGYTPEGMIGSYIQTVWDERGNVSKEDAVASYREENGLFVWDNMSDGTGYRSYYDAEGNLMINIDYVKGEETTRREYTYDAYGAEVERKTYQAGKLMERTVIAYKTAVVSEEFAERFPMFRRVT